MKKTKRGVSLIVLVITIIVMIILASVIVIQLDNSDIIDNANDAVDATNLQEVQELANLKWSEAYMEGIKTKLALEKRVLTGLRESGIDIANYKITVTTKGVKVEQGGQLEAPTISINENTLNIVANTHNGEVTETYTIYVDGVEKATTTETTYDLSTLGLKAGSYEITVKSSSAGYENSNGNNAITYTIALAAPTISINENTLNIIASSENGGLTETYTIYENGVQKATTTATTYDLSTLSFNWGQHYITVRANVEGYQSSKESAGVYYVIDQLYAPTITMSSGTPPGGKYGSSPCVVNITDNSENANFTTEYVIYDGNEEVCTVTKTGEKTVVKLYEYKIIMSGWITVKARSAGFEDSEKSNKKETYIYVNL